MMLRSEGHPTNFMIMPQARARIIRMKGTQEKTKGLHAQSSFSDILTASDGIVAFVSSYCLCISPHLLILSTIECHNCASSAKSSFNWPRGPLFLAAIVLIIAR